MVEIKNNYLYFVLGCVVFVGVSYFVSLFLIVGAGFGALGMWFVACWYHKFYEGGKQRRIERLRGELRRLEGVSS